MTDSYDDIIDLPRHVSKTRPQMSTINRAAQFSPFAALSGHEAAVKETSRLTEQRVELDEYLKNAINAQLQIIADRITEQPPITVTYFQPDPIKDGGTYLTTSGTVKKIDPNKRMITMNDRRTIPIIEIISIEL